MIKILIDAALYVVITVSAVTDIKESRVPNSVTYPAIAVGLGLNALLGGLDGFFNGLAGFGARNMTGVFMRALKLPYETTLKKCILSGILGGWLHILFDAPIYTDIRPFFPFDANPLYGLVSPRAMYLLCTLLFVPALALYLPAARKHAESARGETE